jgi:hypothetical protein
MKFFRRHYGAGPLHLLSLIACFALSGYIVTNIRQVGHWERILVWFAAAILGHDLLVFPLYALADRSMGWLDARRRPERLPTVPWINHLRVPTVMSLLLLAVSWPLVLDRSERTYHSATGLTLAPYENRYLGIVAVMFCVSAITYALRLRRAAGNRAKPETGPTAVAGDERGVPPGESPSRP